MQADWQTETLFYNAPDYFKALLTDIDQAQHSITLETYIFNNDIVGKQVIKALCNAAMRGVAIKVLMDGIGSYEDADIISTQLMQAKIQVRIFSPLPWSFAAHHYPHNQEKWYEKWVAFLGRLNKRSHRKLCIIDNHIAWVGSFNITTYDDQATLDNSWKELAVRVEGEHIEQLQQDFNAVWGSIDQNKYYPRLRYFLSNHSINLRRHKNARLIKYINDARNRIWITNAYFSPSHAFLKAIQKASMRGVSVKIIVPAKSDVIFFPSLSITYYADLLKAGIFIYEYQQNILHEKSMLIDDMAIVGSTNLNYRSFFHDLELDLLLTKPATLCAMEEKFTADIEHSQQITLAKLQRYPTLLLVAGWLSRFLRYWL
jgi:cardiolipin synthase A/B